MPFYEFRNTETDEVVTQLMKISELDAFKAANPNLEQIVGVPMMCDPVRVGVTKNDSGWNEVLSKIHHQNPKSNLKDKLSRS
jgi:hypothetical protein